MEVQRWGNITKNILCTKGVFGYFFAILVSYEQKMCKRKRAVPVP